MHRPADSAWTETRVDSRQATDAETTEPAAGSVPGRARPGCITVPHHVADVRAHSRRVASDEQSVCYSRRIGEGDARSGLSSNPAPRERAERGRTPGVSAMQAYRSASGLLHPQDRHESGDQGSWSERPWS